MQIALLQTAPVWEDKPANLARCTERIAALPATVRLVLLPEMFATGFSMRPEALAEPESGETVQWLCRTAVQCGKAITGSVMIVENGRFYNRLYFVFPDGSYQKYDKRHLFAMGGEQAHYRAGRERLIVLFEGWRICPLICYDLRFPAFSRNIDFSARQTSVPPAPVYDLLLYTASWATARIGMWDALLAARAIENLCYTAGVNRCGTDGAGVAHDGHSQAFDYRGNLLARAADHTESATFITLSLDALHAYREKFPAWRHADCFRFPE